MLIKRRPVKKPQSVGVLCEMRRYPVQYNAYAAAVECVDKRLQPIRVAVAGGGAVIPRGLVAPAVVKRIFAKRHKLNMGIAHLLNVVRKLGCKRGVIKPLPPGTKMHLVYAYGACVYICSPVRPVPHIAFVVPSI